jgi:peptidoglycan hydrolase-like protein with peptidoglycan-binding domain
MLSAIPKLWTRIHPGSWLLIPLVVLSLGGCAKIDPRQVDVDMPSDLPEIKETSFDQPLAELGRMTQIYGKRVMIMGKDITDFTGLSQFGFGEIPRDITEMTKSSLNAIGGNVVYIPYSPVFINNQMVTGYSNFQGKYIPDIVLSGGITEFDRGLETRGASTDFGVTTKPFNVNESWVPGDTISVDYNQENKDSLARITLDFNLLDFKTMSGVARMQTVNSINVYKAVAEKELGFTIFGPSFGLKGTVKKVQGRHAAIRLLVQTSVLQIVGKYLYLPYWKLIPEMKPDPVVLERIRQDFRNLSQTDRIGEIQTCLYLKGYNVPVTGRLDSQTQAALTSFNPGYQPARGVNDPELYVALWSSLGDHMEQVSLRREMLAKALEGSNPAEAVAAAPVKKAPARAIAKPAEKSAPTQVANQKEASKPVQKTAPTEKVSVGPAAVARTNADKPSTGQETAAPVKQQNGQEGVAQLLRSQAVFGNKISAEALINARTRAE